MFEKPQFLAFDGHCNGFGNKLRHLLPSVPHQGGPQFLNFFLCVLLVMNIFNVPCIFWLFCGDLASLHSFMNVRAWYLTKQVFVVKKQRTTGAWSAAPPSKLFTLSVARTCWMWTRGSRWRSGWKGERRESKSEPWQLPEPLPSQAAGTSTYHWRCFLN